MVQHIKHRIIFKLMCIVLIPALAGGFIQYLTSWPNTISNERLKRFRMTTISQIIQTRRWRWLSHVLRMPSNSLPMVVLSLDGHPREKEKKDQPKEKLRRSSLKDLNSICLIKETAPRVDSWKSLVAASLIVHRGLSE